MGDVVIVGTLADEARAQEHIVNNILARNMLAVVTPRTQPKVGFVLAPYGMKCNIRSCSKVLQERDLAGDSRGRLDLTLKGKDPQRMRDLNTGADSAGCFCPSDEHDLTFADCPMNGGEKYASVFISGYPPEYGNRVTLYQVAPRSVPNPLNKWLRSGEGEQIRTADDKYGLPTEGLWASWVSFKHVGKTGIIEAVVSVEVGSWLPQ